MTPPELVQWSVDRQYHQVGSVNIDGRDYLPAPTARARRGEAGSRSIVERRFDLSAAGPSLVMEFGGSTTYPNRLEALSFTADTTALSVDIGCVLDQAVQVDSDSWRSPVRCTDGSQGTIETSAGSGGYIAFGPNRGTRISTVNYSVQIYGPLQVSGTLRDWVGEDGLPVSSSLQATGLLLARSFSVAIASDLQPL
jgi:hypothetical protein